jgi:hypothetical protein
MAAITPEQHVTNWSDEPPNPIRDISEDSRLVFSQWFERITDAIAAERQVKGWSRAKKEALMRGDFDALPSLSRRRRPHPSGSPPSAGSSG